MKQLFLSLFFTIFLIGCDAASNNGNNNGNPKPVVLKKYDCNSQNTLGEDLQVNACYELTLQENVQIYVAGAAYDRTLNQLHSGSQVGSLTLSAAQFAEVERSIGKFLKFQIQQYGTLDLRKIRVTQQVSQENIDGLFHQPDRAFIFGNGNGQTQGECGVAALGIAKGNFSADFKNIQNGEIALTLIGGCNPIVAGATFVFRFTAQQVSSSLQENTGAWDIPNDATQVEARLLAKRWKIDFAAQNGNVVSPQAKDFIQLNPDGTADQVFLNLFNKGSWKYYPASRTLELTGTDGNKYPYIITELTETSLKAYSFGNEFRLSATARPPEDCSGMSSKGCALVSGKWKIRSFKFGLITPTYQPQDFVRFYKDGTYEQSGFGIYYKGTWAFANNETRLLVPTIKDWNIQTLTHAQLSLREGQFDEGELYR